MSSILILGLEKATSDDSQALLESFQVFLEIEDDFKFKRMEWVLGFAQPQMNAYNTFANTYFVEKMNMNYDSPVIYEKGYSFLNLLFQYRKRYEILCLLMLNKLIILLDSCPRIFNYVLNLPPPSISIFHLFFYCYYVIIYLFLN